MSTFPTNMQNILVNKDIILTLPFIHTSLENMQMKFKVDLIQYRFIIIFSKKSPKGVQDACACSCLSVLTFDALWPGCAGNRFSRANVNCWHMRLG